jgi:hypothetical protein
MQHRVVMFGEAEKGKFQKPYTCHCLEQLLEYFGNPPLESFGIELAIQALLFKYDLIFFRVHQEGYSIDDYLFGINYLEKKYTGQKIDALGLPGVGDQLILDATDNILSRFKGFLIINEKDLYDYVTSRC